MLDCVDRKAFTRRQALKTIALASAAALPASSAGNTLRGTAINHVSYSSANYNKTRDFYLDLSEEDSRQPYLWAGDGLISAKNTPRVTAPFRTRNITSEVDNAR
jgi:hypothetical protein